MQKLWDFEALTYAKKLSGQLINLCSDETPSPFFPALEAQVSHWLGTLLLRRSSQSNQHTTECNKQSVHFKSCLHALAASTSCSSAPSSRRGPLCDYLCPGTDSPQPIHFRHFAEGSKTFPDLTTPRLHDQVRQVFRHFQLLVKQSIAQIFSRFVRYLLV